MAAREANSSSSWPPIGQFYNNQLQQKGHTDTKRWRQTLVGQTEKAKRPTQTGQVTN